MLLTDTAIHNLTVASERMKLAAAIIAMEHASEAYRLDQSAGQLDQLLAEIMRKQGFEDMMRECQYRDWLDEQSKFTDQDLQASGLPVG